MLSRGEGNASRNESVLQTTEAPTTRISPTRPRQMAAYLTRGRAPFKLTPRVDQDPRDRPGAIPHPKRGQEKPWPTPRPAGDHGRGRSRDGDPDQFDSTGPCTQAIRLTRLAASAARLISEYLATGAEHVSSV
jgi:hypothetical protein